jgi:hypothetical protein
MTKYEPLRAHLATLADRPRVRMTFAEVATVLGEALQASAFNYSAWWANQSNTANRQWAASWLNAGFVVDGFCQGTDPAECRVEFARRES